MGRGGCARSRCVIRPRVLPFRLSAIPPQMSFEQAAARSRRARTPGSRLRAVQLLKDAAYPEAAVPLARARDRSAGRRAARGDRRGAEHLSRRADRRQEARRAGRRGPQRRAGRAGVFGRARRARRAAGAGRGADRAAHGGARREPARGARGAVRLRHAGGPAGRRRRGATLLRAAGPDLAAFIGVVGSRDAVRGGPRARPRVRAARAGRADRIDGRRRGDHGAERQRSGGQGRRRCRRSARCATSAACRRSPICSRTTARATLAEAALDALARIAHPTSAPLFTAQLSSKSDVAARHRDRRARAGRRSRRSSPRFRPSSTRSASRASTLAGAFALGRCSGTRSTDQVADSLARPRLRDQARRYLIEIAPGRTGAVRPPAARSGSADPRRRRSTRSAWPAIRRRSRCSSR